MIFIKFIHTLELYLHDSHSEFELSSFFCQESYSHFTKHTQKRFHASPVTFKKCNTVSKSVAIFIKFMLTLKYPVHALHRKCQRSSLSNKKVILILQNLLKIASPIHATPRQSQTEYFEKT